MHVPDGFLDVTTSLATGGVAAGAVAVSLRRARSELDERTAPLAGLVAAFVFAVQMLNFPVGVGTSGHLLGGALAAVLVGPWTATLAISVVLFVQALLFADGGLTALGTNITLMALVGVWGGWLTVRAVLAVLPRRPASVVPASFVGALVSVPLAALAFTLLSSLGGAADLPVGGLAAAMLGWHTLIGSRRGGDHSPHGECRRGGASRPRVRRPRPASGARDPHCPRDPHRPRGPPRTCQWRRKSRPVRDRRRDAVAPARRGCELLRQRQPRRPGVRGGEQGLRRVARQTTRSAVHRWPTTARSAASRSESSGVLGVLLTMAVGCWLFRRVSRRADEQVDDRVRARV